MAKRVGGIATYDETVKGLCPEVLCGVEHQWHHTHRKRAEHTASVEHVQLLQSHHCNKWTRHKSNVQTPVQSCCNTTCGATYKPGPVVFDALGAVGGIAGGVSRGTRGARRSVLWPALSNNGCGIFAPCRRCASMLDSLPALPRGDLLSPDSLTALPRGDLDATTRDSDGTGGSESYGSDTLVASTLACVSRVTRPALRFSFLSAPFVP